MQAYWHRPHYQQLLRAVFLCFVLLGLNPPLSLAADSRPTAQPDLDLPQIDMATPASNADARTMLALESQLVTLEQRITRLNQQNRAQIPLPTQTWIWGLSVLLLVALCTLAWLALRLWQIQSNLSATAQASPLPFPANLPSPAGSVSAIYPDTDFLALDSQQDEDFDFDEEASVIDINKARPARGTMLENMFDDGLPNLARSDEQVNLQLEEMSDPLLEAKFWVSVNKPQTAIQLLEEEIEHNRQARAWLYLFDLYRQTGERERFESLRARFHHIFNGQIPDWEEMPAAESPRLADCPRILEALRGQLPGGRAIAYLENLLLDDRGGTRSGFAYGIYCDLVQTLEQLKSGQDKQALSA